MRMYRTQLLLGQAHAPEYVSVYLQEGERVEVDGKAMVDLHGSYVPSTGWTVSKGEALRKAAQEIELVCSQMLAVACRYREAANEAIVEDNRRIRMPVVEGMARTLD